MKRFLTLFGAAALALASVAEEATPATDGAQSPAPSRASDSTAASADSPLVAAAKRAGRLGKKPEFVITNETLKDSAGKGRVTTTTVQHPLPTPPPKSEPSNTDAWLAAQKKAEAEKKAVAERAAAQERQKMRRLSAAAEAAEDGYLDDFAEDPAAAERRLRELESMPADTPPN